MEIKRTANWAESISSILRKTELNLLRIQRTSYLHDEFVRPTSTMTHLDLSMDQRQRPGFFEPEDNSSLIQQELSGVKLAIERLITEKYKMHQGDMHSLGCRVADIEDKQMLFDEIKDELQNALIGLGRKSYGESRKGDDSLKNYASKEDLKILEETFKNTRLHQINQIEMQIRDLRQENTGLKEYIHEIFDEKMKESSKKNISSLELRGIKDEIINETNLKLKELERKINGSVDDLARKYEKQNDDLNRVIKDLTNNLTQKIEENKNNLGSLVVSDINQLKNNIKQFEKEFGNIDELKRNIGNVHNYASEELGKVKKELKILENAFDTQDIESDIDLIKKRLDQVPNQSNLIDFSLYVSREEFNQLDNVQRDLKQLESLVNNQDIYSEIDIIRALIPKDFSKFASKTEVTAEIQHKSKETSENLIKLMHSLEELEQRVSYIENHESSEENFSIELKREEKDKLNTEILPEMKPEENKEYSGLATFGKIEEKEQAELVAISFNNLGESDDDSQGFVSPMISPMNQVLGPMSSSKPVKKFQFADPIVIQEEIHEEEALSPPTKIQDPHTKEVSFSEKPIDISIPEKEKPRDQLKEVKIQEQAAPQTKVVKKAAQNQENMQQKGIIKEKSHDIPPIKISDKPQSKLQRKDLDEYIMAFAQELIKTELEDSLIVVKEIASRFPKAKVGQKHEKLLPKRK